MTLYYGETCALESETSSTRLRSMNPLNLHGARAFFTPWKHGFNVQEALESGEKLYQITLSFPGLPPEFLPYTKKLGNQVGLVLEEGNTMATKLKKGDGAPSIKVLASSTMRMPKVMQLPLLGGGFHNQRVEYTGLPNQCYICRNFGHIANSCPKKQNDKRK